MRKLCVRQGTLCSYIFAVGLAVLIASIGIVSTASTHVARIAHLRSTSYRSTSATVATAQKYRVQRPLRLRTIVTRYLVRPGDTLSSIAKKVYGNANSWPALWWINKATVHNPNEIQAGETLKLSGWHPQLGWIYSAAMKAIPSVSVAVTSNSFDAPTYQAASSSAHAASSPSWSGTASSSFEACVIARESGGNAQVMNSSGHYGLYQFSESTWVAYGGSAADFGHASAAEQHQVFANAVAQGGQSNWSPYDGC